MNLEDPKTYIDARYLWGVETQEQILREIKCGLIGRRRYPVLDTPLEAYSQRSAQWLDGRNKTQSERIKLLSFPDPAGWLSFASTTGDNLS